MAFNVVSEVQLLDLVGVWDGIIRGGMVGVLVVDVALRTLQVRARAVDWDVENLGHVPHVPSGHGRLGRLGKETGMLTNWRGKLRERRGKSRNGG